MLLERLSKGCLASLAELTPTEGQIFRATNVEGQLEAVDNTADNVIETDTRKFMTAKDRQSIDNVVKRVDGLTTDNVIETDDRKFMTAAERNKISDIDNRLDGLTTDNVPETDTHKYFPADFNADDLPETDEHKVMTASEREKLSTINSLAAALWNAGIDASEALISPVKLRDAVNARFGGDLSTGWARMPNGMLVQWGSAASNGSEHGWAVFPTAFTKQCFFLPTMANTWIGVDFLPVVYTDVGDNQNCGSKGFFCRQIRGNGSVASLNDWNVQWLAIGY